MNVLMIGDSFFPDTAGGSHRVIYEEAKQFVEHGHSVFVLTPLRENLPIEEIIDGIHVIRYKKRKGFIGFLDFYLQPCKIIKKMRGTIHFDLIFCHWALTCYKIFKNIKEGKKIYIFHGPAFLEYSIEFEEKNKIFSSVFVHYIKKYEQKTMEISDYIISESEYMRNVLLSNYKIDKKINVMNLACDTKKFDISIDKLQAKDATKISDLDFSILTIRRLRKRMGIDFLIKAMPLILQKIPNAKLYIGGKGPYLNTLKILCKENKVEDKVVFLGFIPDEKIQYYYRAADVFVVPSLNLEGFGLVTLESMASGTVVIGSNACANKEIIGNFDKKLLFETENPDDLALKIYDFYINRHNYVDIKQRNYVLDNYSWERSYESIISIVAD